MPVLFSSLSPFLFFDTLLSVLAFVYLWNRKKTKTVSYLLGFCFFQFLLMLAYFVSSSFPYESVLYFRRFLSGTYIFGNVFYIAYAYSFPADDFPKERKAVLFFAVCAAAAAYIHYFTVTFYVEKYYDFTSHTYAYARSSGLQIGIGSLLMFIFAFAVFCRKYILYRNGKKAEHILGYMFLTLLAFVPSLANSLMRSGRLSEDFYFFIYYFSIPVIVYGLIIIYINDSEETASFRVKIAGIFFISSLMISCFSGYMAAEERDSSYTVSKKGENRYILERLKSGSAVFDSPDLKYIIRNSREKGRSALWSSPDTGSRLLELLAALPEISESAERNYREVLGERFTVFVLQSSEDDTYEFGYDYIEYRKFIHPAALKAVYAMTASALLVIILYPFLFKKTLILPLENLLAGVRSADSGRMDVFVEPTYNDEIGILTKSFNSMLSSIRESSLRLEDYAVNLEKKVADRTKELNERISEISGLKLQQDGDYFLNTLLIEPLMKNRSRSEKYRIDFLIEQKKKFVFREEIHQLGGDVCIAGDLNFAGRRHLMFFNGDAMGKSIQGAGGVLVAGSVLNSIMARNSSEARIQSVRPEEWLKNAFSELQIIFEAFEGCMLLSCILGLADEDTGEVIFFNAEHPYAVLYRDGKAEFAENSVGLYKLGIPFQREFSLKHVRIAPKDVLLIGSDGKDDLLVGNSMNEEAELFLRIAEAAGSDPETMLGLIRESGEILDDISIVRIERLT